MATAVWTVCVFILLVFFGSWAIQIAAWLLVVALRRAGALAMLLFGLASVLALAFLDPKQLARIWRNERTHAADNALRAREHWS